MPGRNTQIPGTTTLLAAACVATGSLANPIDTIRPDAPALAPFGPYAIGVRTEAITLPDSIDVLNIAGDNVPRYDRPLTLEIWYPAAIGTELGSTYTATLRDGVTTVPLTGRAARDAEPAADGQFPLVLISHGYPGNRYLMSHLGENLASKGYVAVAIDHTDSTYSDQAAFGATLLHRPTDQDRVLDHMAGLNGPLGAIVDADRTGIVGFSMGGYGALIYGGAGVTQAATELSWGTPNRLLAAHLAGSDRHEALIDDRIKAVIAIGPWGYNAGIWDMDGMAGLRVPTLFMAGSADDVAVYDAIRGMFDGAIDTERHLLTFVYANHNAAAPIPAPEEAWTPAQGLDFVPFDHYADPVWDTVRMNNIAQHFATAFFDLHLKADASRRDYLDLVPRSEDGIVALDDAGNQTEDHTYWLGFAPRTAAGLRFETKRPGE
ncbi:alpha/beta fold hydrolase [uncultured Tateyamaria sp.]|uniref:alpha/beta hydrolase family protein n=1 Tax=Tateyamaria sp. 1078 TaxID=3417464 RepID=UPI00261BD4EB|nr:alpha/beta fold hydrolase [uncultured Tateyamaria sp.]